MKPQERINAILEAPGLDTQAKVVAIAIASHLSDQDDAWCWPGMATLVRMTGLSDRTIQKVIAWAAAPEVGWLLVERRDGGHWRYAFDWNQLSSPDIPARERGARQGSKPAEPPNGRHPRTGVTPERAAPTPERAAPTPERAATRTDHDPTRNRPVPPDAGARSRPDTAPPPAASVVVEGKPLPADLPALLGGDQRAIVQLARHGIGSTAQLIDTVRLDPKGWFKSGIGAPVAAVVTSALRGFGVDLTAAAQGPPSRASPGRRPSLTDLFGTFEPEPDRPNRIVIEVP